MNELGRIGRRKAASLIQSCVCNRTSICSGEGVGGYNRVQRRDGVGKRKEDAGGGNTGRHVLVGETSSLQLSTWGLEEGHSKGTLRVCKHVFSFELQVHL
jgi:hypothetical protein